jgi:hypothetical protein
LEALQNFKLCNVYKLTRVNDRDTEMPGEVSRVKAIVRGETQLLPDPCRLPFGFSLEPAA